MVLILFINYKDLILSPSYSNKKSRSPIGERDFMLPQYHISSFQELRNQGCSDEEIFEAVAVTSLFNYMDRMADALGAPVERFQDMIEIIAE